MAPLPHAAPLRVVQLMKDGGQKAPLTFLHFGLTGVGAAPAVRFPPEEKELQ